MPVTKQKVTKERPVLRAISLEFVADFLIFDFESGDLKELSNGDPTFPILYGLTKPESREIAKKIQAELREDILPLVTREESVDPSDAYLLLDRLVGKINKMHILPEWGVEPLDYCVGLDDRDPKNPKPILEEKKTLEEIKELHAALGPGQKVLKVLGGRWVVNTNVGVRGPGVAFDTEALRLALYWAIIKSLQDGSFSRLGRCKECQRVFVKNRNNQVFCVEKCSSFYFNRDAKKRRVPQLRARRRREKEVRAVEAARKRVREAENRAFAKFKEFMRLARKKHHNESELDELRPILKRLGGWLRIRPWQKNQDDQIWDGLKEGERKLFYSNAP